MWTFVVPLFVTFSAVSEIVKLTIFPRTHESFCLKKPLLRLRQGQQTKSRL